MARREIKSGLRISLALLQRGGMPGIGSPSTAARPISIGNQASDGGKALTEPMTNMVDAVLLKARLFETNRSEHPVREAEPFTDRIVVLLTGSL
jgi:hypothetical protein